MARIPHITSGRVVLMVPILMQISVLPVLKKIDYQWFLVQQIIVSNRIVIIGSHDIPTIYNNRDQPKS